MKPGFSTSGLFHLGPLKSSLGAVNGAAAAVDVTVTTSDSSSNYKYLWLLLLLLLLLVAGANKTGSICSPPMGISFLQRVLWGVPVDAWDTFRESL